MNTFTHFKTLVKNLSAGQYSKYRILTIPVQNYLDKVAIGLVKISQSKLEEYTIALQNIYDKKDALYGKTKLGYKELDNNRFDAILRKNRTKSIKPDKTTVIQTVPRKYYEPDYPDRLQDPDDPLIDIYTPIMVYFNETFNKIILDKAYPFWSLMEQSYLKFTIYYETQKQITEKDAAGKVIYSYKEFAPFYKHTPSINLSNYLIVSGDNRNAKFSPYDVCPGVFSEAYYKSNYNQANDNLQPKITTTWAEMIKMIMKCFLLI